MKIYLQSAGFEQEHDYVWVDENQSIVDPPTFFKKHESLLQATKPSLIFVKDQNKFLVGVTNLDSDRKDYQKRKIRVSIVWVDENDGNYLTNLLIYLLESFLHKNDFINQIVCSVESKSQVNLDPTRDPGYIVNSFDVFTPKIQSYHPINSQEMLPRKLNKINDDLSNKESLLEELIYDLKSYSLPSEDLPLVIVTGITKQERFNEAGVWRGIAKFVAPIDNKSHETGVEKAKKPNDIVTKLVTIVAILLAVATLTFVITMSLPEQTPKTEESQSQNGSNNCLEESLNWLVEPATQFQESLTLSPESSQISNNCLKNFNKEELTSSNLSNG